MNRGEVWWCEPPDVGRRPAFVLTRQEAIPVLSRVMVVFATRTVRAIPSEVELGPADGMPAACALSFDNVRSVPKAFLTERITRLPAERLREACRALAAATGC